MLPKKFIWATTVLRTPIVFDSMIHYTLLLNLEVHFLRTSVKGMQILVNYSILLILVVILI